MEIELKENDVFLSICNLVNAINTESVMSFEKDKIMMRIVDKSSVMLVRINIDKNLFDKYLVEKNVNFTVDFEIMSKIIRSMKKGFTMTESSNEFIFTSKDGKLKRSIKKYESGLDDRTDPSIPENTINKIELEKFNEIIDEVKDVNEVVNFSVDDGMKIKTKGNLETYELLLDGVKSIPTSVWLSTVYLSKLTKLKNISENIEIRLQKDRAFYCECKGENIDIKCWIAPRMEETDGGV
jgi:DNA polymerase III sliding clamp (beta) subunit (PCNA family)